MADTTTPSAKRLTRAALFGIECRLAKVYGCSPLASKIWLAYARAVGRRCPAVAQMLAKACELGRRPFDNLHGDQVRVREAMTHGQRVVREAIAREQRGERPFMRMRQAG
jgi:hypothetical protein